MRIFPIALLTGVATLATALLAASGKGRATAPPSLDELQKAYEAEATGKNSRKHDVGLKLWQSNCQSAKGSGFACSVSFYSASDPQQTLYMDIALVEPANGGWLLKSGLCRK